MSKTARSVLGLVAFVACYVALTFYVAPLLTQKGGSEPLDADAIGRFPVVIAVPEGSGAASPKYFVVQMRNSHDVTAKAASHTFLLPPGTNRIVDQDGDAATYTAENISPGRQRIHLECMVGDYSRDVEYEAEARKAFPLRDRHTGPQLGLYTIPISVLLALMVFWLTRGRSGKAQQSGAKNSGAKGGN